MKELSIFHDSVNYNGWHHAADEAFVLRPEQARKAVF